MNINAEKDTDDEVAVCGGIWRWEAVSCHYQKLHGGLCVIKNL